MRKTAERSSEQCSTPDKESQEFNVQKNPKMYENHDQGQGTKHMATKPPLLVQSRHPAASLGTQPPLVVQRCNGTTAGLGHLEVGWKAHAQIPPQAVNL
jgi:hypothetical protein